MIKEGDIVEATRRGGQDSQGRPQGVPLPGRIYKVTSIYEMDYGLGCTLEGMDPKPYKGFFLYVDRPGKSVRRGWYFRPARADDDFIADLARRLRGKRGGVSEYEQWRLDQAKTRYGKA